MKNSVNSTASILEKMKQKSVTSQWDVVLHYNRKMTNDLLIKDYVNQFSNGSWYAPINYTSHLVGTENRLDFVDVVLSEPLISFVSQEANIQPTLRLTWFAKSGIIISSHGTDIRYENVLNPLVGPTLVATVPVSRGAVQDGRVYLNIADSTDFAFNFSTTGGERAQVGEQLQAYLIKNLADEHKRIVISEIVDLDSSIWKPTAFKFAVQLPPALRGTRMLDDDANDGAVVVYVALDENSPGGNAIDPLYMIPDDNGFTAAVVISNKILMSHVLQKGFALMGDSVSGVSTLIPVQPDTEEFYYLQASKGEVLVDKSVEFPVNNFNLTMQTISLSSSVPDVSEAAFVCSIEDGELLIKWEGYKAVAINYEGKEYKGELNWQKALNGDFSIKSDTEVTLSVDRGIEGGMLLVPKDTYESSLPYAVLDHWDEISKTFIDAAVEINIDKAMQRFAEHVPDFNTFTLQNILFKNNNVLSLKEVHTPGDLVAFANFRPELTGLEITDPLPKVLIGGTHQFDIYSSVGEKDIKWTVEPLADSKGSLAVDFGSIDELTGLYSAPSEVGGDGFIQVKVKARHEPTNATSFALLSVFHISIMTFPIMFKMSFGSEFPVQAIAHDKSVLNPTWSSSPVGDLVASTTEPNFWIYHSGPMPDDYLPYRLDTITFKSVANGSTTVVKVLVVTSSLMKMGYDPLVEPGTYKFYGISGSSGANKEGKWELLDGPGKIDIDTGIYTCDPNDMNPEIMLKGLFYDGEEIGVDIFKLGSNTASLSNLIRKGQHPAGKRFMHVK